jgi:hypothetical protein
MMIDTDGNLKNSADGFFSCSKKGFILASYKNYDSGSLSSEDVHPCSVVDETTVGKRQLAPSLSPFFSQCRKQPSFLQEWTNCQREREVEATAALSLSLSLSQRKSSDHKKPCFELVTLRGAVLASWWSW